MVYSGQGFIKKIDPDKRLTLVYLQDKKKGCQLDIIHKLDAELTVDNHATLKAYQSNDNKVVALNKILRRLNRKVDRQLTYVDSGGRILLKRATDSYVVMFVRQFRGVISMVDYLDDYCIGFSYITKGSYLDIVGRDRFSQGLRLQVVDNMLEFSNECLTRGNVYGNI